MTSDQQACGYYIVRWTSIPYTLQENYVVEEYDPLVVMKVGELVCNGDYMNAVPWAKLWYTPTQHPLSMLVHMQQVVMASCTLYSVSWEHWLPNTCNKALAVLLGALKLDRHEDECMLEEIHWREMLDHDEYSSDMELDEDDDSDDT